MFPALSTKSFAEQVGLSSPLGLGVVVLSSAHQSSCCARAGNLNSVVCLHLETSAPL